MRGTRRGPRGFSLARMFRLRHLERGQTAVEYVGMVVVVVAVIGGLVGAGVTTELGQKIGAKICQAVGGDCGSGDGGEESAAGDPEDGRQPVDASDGLTPAEREYEQAVRDLEAAERALEGSKDQATEAAKELAKILADELGITDALDCITEGDGAACTETLINVLTSLIGGAIGKLAAKYGAPWKWKKAAELIGKIKRHGGDLYDGLKGIVAGSKKVDRLKDKVDDLKKKLPEKDRKPDNDTKPVACARHSFLPGTPVLLADGTRRAIEDVRVGQRVTVTDPYRGLTTIRPVAATITTEDDKDFTRLTVRVDGRPVAITATDTHPFWLVNRARWADAGDIRPGDELRTPSGGTLPVTAVGHYEKQQRTHDLTIEGIHTYYVGVGAENSLVHNNNGCKEWKADSSVTGPAAGKTLKLPNARHTVKGAKHGQVKEKNSVILKGYEKQVEDDIEAIAQGKAKLVDNGSRYEVNGRTYGVEDTGRIYPDSGPGIANMDRNEYAALKEIAKANGDVNAPALTKNPRFANNPQAVQKAREVYEGTYKSP